MIIIEILFDGALLFLTSYGVFSNGQKLKAKDSLLFLSFTVLCTVARISFLAGSESQSLLIETTGYEIIPVNDVGLFIFLILAVLVLNSVWSKKDAMYTSFGTMAMFSVFIIVRGIFVLIFYGFDGITSNYNPIIIRIGAVLLFSVLLFTSFFKSLHDRLNNGSFLTKFLIGNTSVLLIAVIVLLDFDATKTESRMMFVLAAASIIIIVNVIVGAYDQKRSAEIMRINMMEQYIPVIEELISQVRARQHEFNNRLLAISVVVQTSENLLQAKEEIEELTAGLRLSVSETSLLNCDSKIIAGMIFSKMKFAETKNITVVSEVTASLKGRTIRELDLFEILSILIDNAIEASNAGDTVHILIEDTEDGLVLLVSNPYSEQSGTDFVLMFRRGFSTKGNGDTRGHGLANVKSIVERYRGKIIARNETMLEQNYVTLGVVFQ